jgi:hypothetical protein
MPSEYDFRTRQEEQEQEQIQRQSDQEYQLALFLQLKKAREERIKAERALFSSVVDKFGDKILAILTDYFYAVVSDAQPCVRCQYKENEEHCSGFIWELYNYSGIIFVVLKRLESKSESPAPSVPWWYQDQQPPVLEDTTLILEIKHDIPGSNANKRHLVDVLHAHTGLDVYIPTPPPKYNTLFQTHEDTPGFMG